MWELSKEVISYPYVVASDIHLHNWSAYSHTNKNGINNRLQHILDGIEYAAASLLRAGGSDFLIAGDLFHSRGNIKPSVYNPAFDLFSDLSARGINFFAIGGNHDLEGKNSDRLGNALTGFSAIENFHVFDKPTQLESGHVFIPWYEDCQKVLKLANEKANEVSKLTVVCHVGLNEVLPSNISNTLDPSDFLEKDYKYVFCGHFHNHVNFDSRVYSIGALTHQTWGDVGTRAGFLLVNEDSVEQIATKAPRFVSLDTLDTWTVPMVKGHYVRLTGTTYGGKKGDFANAVLKEGALAVLDQTVEPKEEKDFSIKIETSGTREEAVRSYCKREFGEDWEKVFNECMRT